MQIHDINTAIVELTTLYDEINNHWTKDRCSTDLYQTFRQKEYYKLFLLLEKVNFERLIIEVLNKSLSYKILIRLKSLIETNIQIYESRQTDFNNVDFHALYTLDEESMFAGRLEILKKDREEIQDYPYPTEQERTILLKENQQEINQLRNEQSDYLRSNSWMSENHYSKIQKLSIFYLSLINSYFSIEKEEESIPIEENNSDQKEDIVNTQTIEIEPDMIFRTNMFDKFLLLEKKLIVDKYLDENLNWISKHDNGIVDRKRLVAFLVGLVENRYFLPNKDPKIKSFFESRYKINIGQNFEKSRRSSLVNEYLIIFHDYSF